MIRSHHRIRWAVFCMLTGALFQTTAASCGELAVTTAGDVVTSILHQFIRNSVNQALGLGSGTNFGSLLGAGT